MPSFMSEVLHYKVQSNGELSSIPFLTCSIFIVISAIISDKITQKNLMSRIAIRKLLNSIGFIGPIITFIGLMFVTQSNRVIGFLLILTNITIRYSIYLNDT